MFIKVSQHYLQPFLRLYSVLFCLHPFCFCNMKLTNASPPYLCLPRSLLCNEKKYLFFCGKLMVLLTEKLQGNLYQKLRLSVFFLFSLFFWVVGVGVGFKMCLQATLTSYLFCRVKKKNALDRCITCGQLSFLVVL